jgi:NAD(P)-dependent dehydrogenase (short-subunit alcohol dehydrogenase family)
MNISLAGKVAIVTGAASGIGLATVQQFLDSDAAGVVAVDLSPQLVKVLSEACPKHGGRLQFVQGDVAQPSTAAEFAQIALDHFGRIDVLVNNAGISVVKPLHETSSEEWDRVMNVNVKAALFAARSVVPAMIKAGGGVILNTGSISGVAGIPGQGVYGPSKGAIHQLTRQMAIEYAAHNIRVNCIGCGTIDTPLVHASAQASGDPEKFWKMLNDNHPIGRIAAPAEVAAFFTYLASDLASFFTGAILMLDGGFTAK